MTDFGGVKSRKRGGVPMTSSGAVAYVRGIIPDSENRERDDWYSHAPRRHASAFARRVLSGVDMERRAKLRKWFAEVPE